MKIFRTWTFKWWEVSLLKICLLSFGIILGITYAQNLAGLMWLWWMLFAVTAVYFLIRFFKDDCKK